MECLARPEQPHNRIVLRECIGCEHPGRRGNLPPRLDIQRAEHARAVGGPRVLRPAFPLLTGNIDRKSTRLNSSHSQISYAVFCLRKKNCGHGVNPSIHYKYLYGNLRTVQIWETSLLFQRVQDKRYKRLTENMRLRRQWEELFGVILSAYKT